MKKTLLIIALAVLFAAPAIHASAAGTTAVTWYGHSAFKFVTPAGKILLIDPWITNPANKNGDKDLAAIDKADLILLTHAHGDHVGNTVEIAKRTGAKLVATFDVGKAMVQYGGFPEKQFGYPTTGNFGGEISLLDGDVKVTFVPAVHSSAIDAPETSAMPKNLMCAGSPGGFVVAVKDGATLYHTGDTDLFADMGLVGKFNTIDIMMACIGDRFTMGPKRAAEAVKLVKPKLVVPMHFGTFPVLTGTVEGFADELKKAKVPAKLKVMTIGETIVYPMK